jgi:S-formylglutathione hydrolase FrmB
MLASCLWGSLASAGVHLSRSVDSAALGGPLRYSVYLPPDYDSDTERHYPAVYLLHGVGDNERSWPGVGQLESIMDELIMARQVPGMLVVMPSGKVSWHVDSAAFDGPGDYESALVDDLIEHVDNTYRTLGTPQSRAITGHSMGGFGALRLAFKYPEHFAATAGLSPALWSHVTPETELSPRRQRIFRGSFGQPFDPARFLSQELRAFLDDLERADNRPAIFLHAGDDDFFGIYKSTTALFSQLRNRNIPAELRIRDGGHLWQYWRDVIPTVMTDFAEIFSHTAPLQVATKEASNAGAPARVVVPDDTMDVAQAMKMLPNAGGTVFVRARKACYVIKESIHMNRSNLSLIGEQGATLCLADGIRQPVVLVGSAAPSVPESDHVHNIRIADLTIDGNRMNQGRDARSEDARGRPHLKNNAVSVHGAQNVYLDRVTLRSARSGGLVVSQRSRGIYATSLVVVDNHFDGIAVDGGHEVLITNFKAEGNLASGLSIDTGSSELQFSNGLVVRNGDNGIFIRDTKEATFRGLAIRDNCRHGVFASHVVDGEPIAHSGVRGLVFSDLDVVRNGEAGFYYGSANREPYFSAHNVVHNSRFGGNKMGAIAGNPDGTAELATNNLLSPAMGASGPDGNALCH